MAALLIVAHAPLATALAAVAAHVDSAAATPVEALDVSPAMAPDAVDAALRAALLRLQAGDGGEVLVLADVFGASPCNAAMRVVDGQRSRVVTGVNVPMVWRALTYAREPLETLVARAVGGATQGVMQVAPPRRQNQTTAVARSDANHAHHQQ
jgi:PTS system ascorbate-specific IIA component